MLLSVPDLSAILVQAQHGSSAAIHALYDAYGAAVYRYCYARLHDRESAEDCVQEVFERIYKGIGAFDYRGDASFMAWMYTIAYNVVISYTRKHKPAQHVPLTPELNLPDARFTDPARTICDGLALRDAIGQLPHDQQQVVLLKFFVGLSNAEIANILDRNEGAVKALQHRAILRLQRVLVAEHGDGAAALRPADGT